MQAPTGGTTQPPRECGGTCDPNVQRRIHRGPGHDRQRLPIAAMGQAHPTSAGHAKLDARVKSRSHKIGVRDIKWTV